MDKVKEYLAIVVKYHFWGVAAIVVIVGMLAWYMATGSLNSEYEANAAAIASATQSADAVIGVPNHPNDEYTEGMKLLLRERRMSVLDAWQAMYQQQRKEILVWPPELPAVFHEEIRRVVRDDSFEQINPEENRGEREIARHFRETYRNYIQSELPKLAQTIKARWNPGNMNPEDVGIGDVGGAKPKALNDPYLMDWNSKNQAFLQTELFEWPDQIPSTLQLLYAQEDLWVLQALMKVIAKTNEPADARHKAAIRSIESIQIGKYVGNRAGQITPYLKPVAPGAEGAGGGRPPVPPPPPPPPPVAPGAPGAPGAAPSNHPANLRYVDDKYEPLTAEALLAATATQDATTAYLAVAKRMPIRLQLRMDTRKLNKLLAECGNSALPIEIQQVRINTEFAPEGGGPGGGLPGMVPGLGRGEGGFAPPPRPIGPRLQPGGDLGQNNAGEDTFPYDMPVEIYGIIYIFNPVNAKKLGTEEDLESLTLPAGATPAAPSDAAPSPPVDPGAAAPVPMAPAPMPPMGAAPIAPVPMAPAPMAAPPAPMPAVPPPMGAAPMAPAPGPGPAAAPAM